MKQAIGMVQKRKKHPHTASGSWEILRTAKHPSVIVHANLIVQQVNEYRYWYPPGNGPACCKERRLCIYVSGAIASLRDFRAVEKALKKLA